MDEHALDWSAAGRKSQIDAQAAQHLDELRRGQEGVVGPRCRVGHVWQHCDDRSSVKGLHGRDADQAAVDQIE